MEKVNVRFGMETDKIYVGDICYALRNDIYHGVWGKKMNYEDGVIEYEGKPVAVVGGTEHGDGDYDDNKGHTFSVDAGIIGVVDLNYRDKKARDLDDLGVTFRIPSGKAIVDFESYRGDFQITIEDAVSHKKIYNADFGTSYEPEEDDEDYDDEEEEDW